MTKLDFLSGTWLASFKTRAEIADLWRQGKISWTVYSLGYRWGSD